MKLWRNDNSRRNIYLLTYSSVLRPSQILTSLITDARSSLSTAYCRHLFILISFRYFLTFSSHLDICFPFLLFPSGLISNVFLFIFWFILATCPIHSNLFFLISATMSTSIRMYRCIDVSPSIPQQFLLSISLLYHRSTYPSQYFPLPCTQSFHIHLSHSRRFTPKH